MKKSILLFLIFSSGNLFSASTRSTKMQEAISEVLPITEVAKIVEEYAAPTKEEVEEANKHLLYYVSLSTKLLSSEYLPLRLQQLQEIIDQGASNLEDALFIAVLNGNILAIKLLIENGANINAKNTLGDSPLLLAIKLNPANKNLLDNIRGISKDDNVKKLLVLKSRNLLDDMNEGDDPRYRLEKTIESDLPTIIRTLLELGADPFITDTNGEDFFSLIRNLDRTARLQIINTYKDYSQNVKEELETRFPRDISKIVEEYTQPVELPKKFEEYSRPTKEETDRQNEILLHYVGMPSHLKDLAEEIQEAIDNGATNLNEALFTAAKRGNLTAIQVLIANKADVNTIDEDGNTPLLFAMIYNQADFQLPEIVKALLEAGADTSIKNNNGSDFLLLAKSLIPEIHDSVMKVYKEYAQNVCNEIFEANENMPRELACIISEYVAPKIK